MTSQTLLSIIGSQVDLADTGLIARRDALEVRELHLMDVRRTAGLELRYTNYADAGSALHTLRAELSTVRAQLGIWRNAR